MKAMEKDRDRRYDTANSLAADIERYLHNETVQACPPSASYRFRKFVRSAQDRSCRRHCSRRRDCVGRCRDDRRHGLGFAGTKSG